MSSALVQYDPKTGEIVQQHQGRPGEMAATAQASLAKAEVEARFAMAQYNPRDPDQVRHRLMRDCDRPGFAEVAQYSRPVGGGKKAVGPSIRFVESALRAMRNVDIDTATVYDDKAKRIVKVTVTDLEANVTYKKQITLNKTVERKFLKDGQVALGTRINSYGKEVHIVEATEDDLAVKEAAQVSKAVRTLGLRIIDGDLTAEAIQRCNHTLHNRDQKNPGEAAKRIADAFGSVGITPKDLSKYLGCKLSQVAPAQLNGLRGLYAAIRDGETTWVEVMASTKEESDPAADDASEKQTAAAKKAKAKLKRKKKAEEATPEPAADPEPETGPPSDEEQEAIKADEREQGGLI